MIHKSNVFPFRLGEAVTRIGTLRKKIKMEFNTASAIVNLSTETHSSTK